jgi:hypothetical protein
LSLLESLDPQPASTSANNPMTRASHDDLLLNPLLAFI